MKTSLQRSGGNKTVDAPDIQASTSCLQHLHSDGLKLSLERWLLDPGHISIAHGHQTNPTRDGCDCRKVLLSVDLVVSRSRQSKTSFLKFVDVESEALYRLPHSH